MTTTLTLAATAVVLSPAPVSKTTVLPSVSLTVGCLTTVTGGRPTEDSCADPLVSDNRGLCRRSAKSTRVSQSAWLNEDKIRRHATAMTEEWVVTRVKKEAKGRTKQRLE